MELKKEYKDKFSKHGDRSLSLEFVKAGNYVGIRASGGTLLVVLSDEQVIELANDLDEWINNKEA